MDKSKISKVDKPKSDGGNSTALKYEQSVYLKHRKNQALEYKWGGKYYRFEAYESKKLPIEILKSRNFEKSTKNFTVQKGE